MSPLSSVFILFFKSVTQSVWLKISVSLSSGSAAGHQKNVAPLTFSIFKLYFKLLNPYFPFSGEITFQIINNMHFFPLTSDNM